MERVPTGIPDEVPARYLHTAVWTGSEMIVWGGNNGPGYTGGGRYNPTTDSWSLVSTTNEPTYRDYHTAVWTGTAMIVWGGIDRIPNTYANRARGPIPRPTLGRRRTRQVRPTRGRITRQCGPAAKWSSGVALVMQAS